MWQITAMELTSGRDLLRADPWMVVWEFTETEVVAALHKQTRLEPPLSPDELEAALDKLADYAANETTFGPVLQVIVPLLIGVGILLVGVAMFMRDTY